MATEEAEGISLFRQHLERVLNGDGYVYDTKDKDLNRLLSIFDSLIVRGIQPEQAIRTAGCLVTHFVPDNTIGA